MKKLMLLVAMMMVGVVACEEKAATPAPAEAVKPAEAAKPAEGEAKPAEGGAAAPESQPAP